MISDRRAMQFWRHVDFSGSCWLWQGFVGRDGYGRTGMWFADRYETYVHRVAFRLLTQTEPKELDHLCRVRNCVNPDHLQSVTRKINARRGVSLAAHRARQTHCLRGHPLEGE